MAVIIRLGEFSSEAHLQLLSPSLSCMREGQPESKNLPLGILYLTFKREFIILISHLS